MENPIKELLGPLVYPIARQFLGSTRIDFDGAAGVVNVTKDGERHALTFEQIEKAVNNA